MQFSTSLLAATAALLTTASADGVFGISATTVASSPISITLAVLNGLVGEPATCQGTVQVASLPASGTIPCTNAGFSLSFTWADYNQGIQATYATPTSPAFTYNVPRTGCDAAQPQTCTFGFQNIFPGVTALAFRA
ncbi:hypothetical protein HYFRA_00005042 [Hymenoscyphus fraxineus]|uniref:AA1-like domain-containing protein n=1 Tax=Hymenoscyphus fraxineus TaxID=746836 RepID=A0A9N9KLX3_9HELO|nr:hypothetical protein HYFRA_00005042 [Hymenoscyphus fraxineus]